jgi:hypothetical protein
LPGNNNDDDDDDDSNNNTSRVEMLSHTGILTL